MASKAALTWSSREIGGHGLFLDGFAFGVLGVGGLPEGDGADVFLVLGHEEVGEAGAVAEHENEHAGGHGVERAAMADLLHVQAAPGDGDDIVRSHVLAFVHQEDAANQFV
jgi:hypothetical protein